MRNRKRIIVVILVVALAVIAAPYGIRAGVLWWLKLQAKENATAWNASTIANLNKVPQSVILPSAVDAGNPTTTVEVGDYVVQVPRALPSSTTAPSSRMAQTKSVLLIYPQFQVRIRSPFSTAAADSLARQLHFKDFLGYESTAMSTRWDELDSQRDAQSLRRFLLFISEKPATTYCRLKFVGPDLSGFVMAPADAGKRTIVELFIPADHISCGVWFEGQGDLNDSDLLAYLANMKFKHKPQK